MGEASIELRLAATSPSLGITQGTLKPAAELVKKLQAVCKLCEAGSQGVSKVRQVVFMRLIQIQIWLCGRRSQHRDNGGSTITGGHTQHTQGKL